jgi:twitching motility two-component system response regulator PilG
MAGIEKRRHKRVPYNEDVLINGTIMVKGLNISEGGLYVHTGRLFPLDSLVTLKFALGGRELEVKAQIKSCQMSIGMGLNFVGISDYELDYVRDYVDEHGQEAAGGGKKKVLLVDDNEAARRINKSKLMLEGLAVTEAKDGVEAIERMNAEMPDLVVMDLYMDKMDGYKLLSYMKSSESLKGVPVVVFSARGAPAEIQRAIAAGAKEFLVKSMTSPAKLTEHVKKLLGI